MPWIGPINPPTHWFRSEIITDSFIINKNDQRNFARHNSLAWEDQSYQIDDCQEHVEIDILLFE